MEKTKNLPQLKRKSSLLWELKHKNYWSIAKEISRLLLTVCTCVYLPLQWIFSNLSVNAIDFHSLSKGEAEWENNTFYETLKIPSG